jgi:hypothetical protein
MLLGIAAELSAPPSSPTSFREVTLYGRMYRGYEVVAICLPGEEDFYAPWFKRYGLWDYVADLLPRDQVDELAAEIEGGPGTRLTAFNVNHVLSLL